MSCVIFYKIPNALCAFDPPRGRISTLHFIQKILRFGLDSNSITRKTENFNTPLKVFIDRIQYFWRESRFCPAFRNVRWQTVKFVINCRQSQERRSFYVFISRYSNRRPPALSRFSLYSVCVSRPSRPVRAERKTAVKRRTVCPRRVTLESHSVVSWRSPSTLRNNSGLWTVLSKNKIFPEKSLGNCQML